jgi:hypothetical protein
MRMVGGRCVIVRAARVLVVGKAQVAVLMAVAVVVAAHMAV